MAAIYSNGGNHWNVIGFNFTKRDALSSVYKIIWASLTVSWLIELKRMHYGAYVHGTFTTRIKIPSAFRLI